jgi:hypothetical protein
MLGIRLRVSHNRMTSNKTAADHANMEFLSVNVLNVEDVQVDKSVIEALQRDYGKIETTWRLR